MPRFQFFCRLSTLFGWLSLLVWALPMSVTAQGNEPGSSPLLDFIQSQPIDFQEIKSNSYLRNGDELIGKWSFREIGCQLPTERPGGKTGVLWQGKDSLTFSAETMADGANYFVFTSDSAFDRWLMRGFPDLGIPVAEDGGLKVYSYREAKKTDEKRYKLDLILRQMGIPVQKEGSLAYAGLDHLRDAIGSCIVQWVVSNRDKSQLSIEEGRFRAIPHSQVQVLKEDRQVLAGSFEKGKFTAPGESRTTYLWLFVGMLAGGGIMALVVLVIGKGKKDGKGRANGESQEKMEKILQQIADNPRRGQSPEFLEMIKGALEGNDPEGLENLEAMMSGAGEERAAGPLEEALTNAMKELEMPDRESAQNEQKAGLAMVRDIFEAIGSEMEVRGSEEGALITEEFRRRLVELALIVRGLRSLGDGKTTDEVRIDLEHQRETYMNGDEWPELDGPDLVAEKELAGALERIHTLQKRINTPDRLRNYLSQLEKRFGRLSEQLGKMADPPTAGEREELLTRMVNLALHINDFMRVYLGEPHSEATKLNPALIERGIAVAGMSHGEYKVFSESISQVPRAVRSLRAIVRAAGIRKLDEVLVEGFYIPPAALQD